MLAFGDQPGMDDPLEPLPASARGPGAGWGQPPLPQQQLYGGVGGVAAASARYPSVMPEGYPPPPPPPASQLPPYPGAPYPGAAPALNPYGPVPPPPHFPSAYTAAAGGPAGGGVSSAPGGSPLHPYGGAAAAGAAPEQLTAAMGSLSLSRGQTPHHHHGSAPDLSSSVAVAGAGEGGRPAIGVAGIMMREQQKTEQSGRWAAGDAA